MIYLYRKLDKYPLVELPTYQTPGSIGIDLAAAQTTIIHPDEIALVPTGLVMRVQQPDNQNGEPLPDNRNFGYGLFLYARSSLARKHGLMLSNNVGVVDFDYIGEDDEIMLSLWNFTEGNVTVHAGQRIAQAVIHQVLRPSLIEIDHAEVTNRGGFGSTGE